MYETVKDEVNRIVETMFLDYGHKKVQVCLGDSRLGQSSVLVGYKLVMVGRCQSDSGGGQPQDGINERSTAQSEHRMGPKSVSFLSLTPRTESYSK